MSGSENARTLFGTDGIRGRANQHPMTPDIVMKAAMVAGSRFKNGKRRGRVVIGKDTRQSCYMFEQAATAGFCAAGLEVIVLGPLPTPAVAMVTRSMRADLGVMISASHNPYTDNGIKFFGPDGYKLSDETELEIERGIAALSNGTSLYVSSEEVGNVQRLNDVQGRYVEAIKKSLSPDRTFNGLKVVLDCAHGAAYQVAPTVLWELGADVVKIGCEPDGRNINKGCGATDTALLSERVVAEGAHLGVALDGDADRLILVDCNGRKIDGDQIMALLAGRWQRKNLLRGGTLVATIMSNMGLERYLQGEAIRLHRTKVGDRYVLEAMREGGFNIGGEQSGHMILSDYATTGDGLLTAVQIMAELTGSDNSTAESLNVFEPMPQVLKNARFSGGDPLASSRFREAQKACASELGSSGRIVIRKSGTEPLIRVMVEGEDEAQINRIADDLKAEILAA